MFIYPQRKKEIARLVQDMARKMRQRFSFVHLACPNVPVMDSDIEDLILDTVYQAASQYRMALESLTPGGSEFYDDPDRCVSFVKDHDQSQHRHLIELVKIRNQQDNLIRDLKSQIEALEAAKNNSSV
jgi:hypothetical protein